MDKQKNILIETIEAALEEEKQSAWKRWMKVFGVATTITGLVFSIFYFLWPRSVATSLFIMISFFWVVLVTGFSLYFYPQPRLEVRSYFSYWGWAKILIAMSIITMLEVLLCPELASLSGLPNPLSSISDKVTHIFMDAGGMKLCMFLCGVIFSGAGTLVSLIFVRKSIRGINFKEVFKILGIVLLGQTPVLALQAFNAGSQIYLLYWLTGSIIAVLSITLLLRLRVKT